MENDRDLDVRMALAENNIENLQKTLLAYNDDFTRRLQEAESRIILTLDHRISAHDDRIATLTNKVEKLVDEIKQISISDLEDKTRSQQTIAAVVVIVALIQLWLKFS